MLRAAAACLVLAAAAASPAAAATARTTLGSATIVYDPAVWKATVTGNDGVNFTCIATDCTGQPRVYANTETPREIGTDIATAKRQGRTMPDDGVPSLPFPVVTYSSGCAARDTPILFAGGLIDTTGYRFITNIVPGCNFGPVMPVARFTELVRGFETN